jgi:hypothetical protein
MFLSNNSDLRRIKLNPETSVGPSIIEIKIAGNSVVILMSTANLQKMIANAR